MGQSKMDSRSCSGSSASCGSLSISIGLKQACFSSASRLTLTIFLLLILVSSSTSSCSSTISHIPVFMCFLRLFLQRLMISMKFFFMCRISVWVWSSILLVSACISRTSLVILSFYCFTLLSCSLYNCLQLKNTRFMCYRGATPTISRRVISKRVTLIPDSISQIRDVFPLASSKRISMLVRVPFRHSVMVLVEFSFHASCELMAYFLSTPSKTESRVYRNSFARIQSGLGSNTPKCSNSVRILICRVLGYRTWCWIIAAFFILNLYIILRQGGRKECLAIRKKYLRHIKMGNRRPL